MPPALRRLIAAVGLSVAAAVVATLLAAGATVLVGRNPFLVITDLVTAPLASPYRFAEALGRSCPLMLCGLAVAIAFRAQAWNIGVEGQYLMGATAATAVGLCGAQLPGFVLIPMVLLASAIAGALYAVPAAVLEIRRGVPLVLSTILLNFVASGFVEYLTQGPMRGADPSAAQTNPIAHQAYLPALVAHTDLHWGFVGAVASAMALWILLRWTVGGFHMRVVGANPVAAEWAGIGVNAVKLRVMCLSGLLAGLAGGIQIAGVYRLLNIGASEGFGYVGIVVALLGRLHPLGTALAAIAIGLLSG
jgi:general nucleoside transport system permease protein